MGRTTTTQVIAGQLDPSAVAEPGGTMPLAGGIIAPALPVRVVGMVELLQEARIMVNLLRIICGHLEVLSDSDDETFDIDDTPVG